MPLTSHTSIPPAVSGPRPRAWNASYGSQVIWPSDPASRNCPAVRNRDRGDMRAARICLSLWVAPNLSSREAALGQNAYGPHT